ncbi:hypothetical protein [Streptomyces sp. NPDC102487]|uniref:hypothetical protein n=1 Tax=Streptomyces sp. NPDC102487 TaxID=3366182 RepID=UPI0037FAA6E8
MKGVCGQCGAEGIDGHLCQRDAVALDQRLADLPTLYREVDACLVPRRSGWGEIIATKSGAGPRSPINEDVLDTINWGRATEVMRCWRVDVQRLHWPHHRPPLPAPLDVDCGWLARELEWIVAHYEAAGDLAREVSALEGQARQIVGDPRPRPQQLGSCVAVVDDQGTVCGEPITRVPGQTRLACRACHTVYGGEQDLLLLWHYQPQPEAPLSHPPVIPSGT